MSDTTEPTPASTPPASTPADVVTITRTGIDKFLIGLGVVVTIVLAVAGALLMWGSTFAEDYVRDELGAQNISFPPAESLTQEGRDDLAEYGGQLVDTGSEAEAYASYIAGHIDRIGGGMSYAELGGPEREARSAVEDAIANGASQDEVDELQAAADQASSTRDTVFRGEILRGTLLNTYAWWTIGRIAGIAAWVAFVAAVACLALVIAGLLHMRKHRTA